MSMDDMMRMSFDELRSHVAPNGSVIGTAGPMLTMGGRSVASASSQPRILAAPVVPDNPQELDVYLVGPGSEKLSGRPPEFGRLDSARAMQICKGRRDFVRARDCSPCPHPVSR